MVASSGASEVPMDAQTIAQGTIALRALRSRAGGFIGERNLGLHPRLSHSAPSGLEEGDGLEIGLRALIRIAQGTIALRALRGQARN